MAYDNKTILDIVKAVDEKNVYKMADEVNKTSKFNSKFKPTLIRNAETASKMLEKVTPGSLEMEVLKRERKDIPQLAEEVLSEENPLAGGTFEGSVYYSNILPQGKGDIPWTKEASIIVQNAAQHNAKKSDILKAQKYFTDIGYMHESEIDGYKGKQLQGMIKRWNLNAAKSSDSIMDAMKTWKDRLFDGGAEEYEEDFREGGGDQGY